MEAERSILGRTDTELTARAGYAGGKAGALDGKVCYHNAKGISDYGKLGHAEVVGLQIPANRFEDFAIEYCKLFDKDGLRPDQFGDRGTEYRNLVGVPGGKNSQYAKLLVDASMKTGDKLDFAVGKGDDKDLPKVSTYKIFSSLWIRALLNSNPLQSIFARSPSSWIRTNFPSL